MAVFLFADIKLETVESFRNVKVLMAKVMNNKFYFLRSDKYPLKCPFRDAFLLNGLEVEIGEEDNKVCIVQLEKDKIIKKVVINGNFVKDLKINEFLYVATKNKIYKLDKHLNIIKIYKSKTKINNLLLLHNKIFYVSGKSIYFLDGEKFIKFDDMSVFVGFYAKGDNLFEIFKDIALSGSVPVSVGGQIMYVDLKNNYIIQNISKNYSIIVDFYPKKLVMIDDVLYVVGDKKIEAYKRDKKLFSIDINDEVLNILKYDNKIYVVFPKKIVFIKNVFLIENMECKELDNAPFEILHNKNKIYVVFNRRIKAYDKHLNFLWERNFEAKINRVRIIDGFIYLIGSKKAKFWIAKLNTSGKILKEITFFNVAEGFDITKNGEDFIAVGYKYFDHLGKFIKRQLIVLVDKNLNLIASRTYGDAEGVLEWIFKKNNYFLSFGTFGKKSVVLEINKYGFLNWFKLLKDNIYDVKKTDNSIIVSTEKGVYFFKNRDILKYKDYEEAGIIDRDRFFIDNDLIDKGETKTFKDFSIYDGFYDKKFYLIGSKEKEYFICKY